jgi:hypothetical protein
LAAWLFFFSVGLIVALSLRKPPKESFEEAGYGSNSVFVRSAIWT